MLLDCPQSSRDILRARRLMAGVPVRPLPPAEWRGSRRRRSGLVLPGARRIDCAATYCLRERNITFHSRTPCSAARRTSRRPGFGTDAAHGNDVSRPATSSGAASCGATGPATPVISLLSRLAAGLARETLQGGGHITPARARSWHPSRPHPHRVHSVTPRECPPPRMSRLGGPWTVGRSRAT